MRKPSWMCGVSLQIAKLCASEEGRRAGKGTVHQGSALLQPRASVSFAGSRLHLGRGALGKDCTLWPNELFRG